MKVTKISVCLALLLLVVAPSNFLPAATADSPPLLNFFDGSPNTVVSRPTAQPASAFPDATAAAASQPNALSGVAKNIESNTSTGRAKTDATSNTNDSLAASLKALEDLQKISAKAVQEASSTPSTQTVAPIAPAQPAPVTTDNNTPLATTQPSSPAAAAQAAPVPAPAVPATAPASSFASSSVNTPADKKATAQPYVASGEVRADKPTQPASPPIQQTQLATTATATPTAMPKEAEAAETHEEPAPPESTSTSELVTSTTAQPTSLVTTSTATTQASLVTTSTAIPSSAKPTEPSKAPTPTTSLVTTTTLPPSQPGATPGATLKPTTTAAQTPPQPGGIAGTTLKPTTTAVTTPPHHLVELAEPEPSITPSDLEQEASVIEHMQQDILNEELSNEIETARFTTTRANNEELLKKTVYLGSYLEPWRVAPDEPLEFTFENADLTALISYIEEKFNIKFIPDDSINPLPAGGKSLLGTKISFKTHAPLSKKDAWDIFVTFLDMAGVAPIPASTPRVYRLISSKDPKSPTDATRSPLPTFIGVDASLIPDNDTLIRYVYFVENTTLDSIATIADAIKSPLAPTLVKFPELNAIIITDRANNIKSILTILHELDQTTTQEALAVIKLERTDAVKAAKIYADFTKQETAHGVAARFMAGRKSSTADYFPRGTKVIPESRTNSLIVLGTREAIKTVSDFIVNIVDKPDDRPEAPRYIYRLKYLSADNTASLLNDVLKFKSDSDAAKSGGVRDGDKYFKPISIVAEPATNSLIIGADFEDYSHLRDLLNSLDIEQPQIALRLFLLSLDLSDNKNFGIQMRNKIPGPNGLLGNNVNFQTSGLAGVNSGVVENTTTGSPGATRLLGNLVSLAAGAPIGSTVVTLGSDVFGVWGILNMLENYTKTNIVANPFLVTTNKYQAQFQLGEKRMVVDANITTQATTQAFKQLNAVLDIRITPQISREGLVTLSVAFDLEQFTDPNPDSNNGNRTVKQIETTVIVANNEVLALGGLIQNSVVENVTQVPILGDIPLIGWLFKNKVKFVEKTSLLLLIQAEIIEPVAHSQSVKAFTQQQVYDAKADSHMPENLRDPVSRYFFKDARNLPDEILDKFMDSRNKYTQEAVEEREKREAITGQSEALLPDQPPIEAKLPPRRGRYRRKKEKLPKQQKRICPPQKDKIFGEKTTPRISGATNLLDAFNTEVKSS